MNAQALTAALGTGGFKNVELPENIKQVIPTTDHDAGPPLLYMPVVGFLVPVVLDGHRWVLLLLGDPVAELLVGRLEARGEFPKRFKLADGSGPYGAVGWRLSDIEAWIGQRASTAHEHEVA